ncbi:ABC transporter ATP-binding protein [Croceicoccus bisphenolivorans]|uniref:ABC transporter ATP-binding protein n=1 Tax=Croceicoccus bisphenolivorans TaxID=1783232 RepID=UPI000831E90E|nr:ABC transporter ATP-binding protein [Croceicoccus bisphenolivorans]
MMLSAENLTVRRGAAKVVTEASFALEPGRLTAIVGPNGAGKSSVLAALAGLLPASGKVMLDGRDITTIAPRERARTIGFLPQQAEAAWDVSVRTLVGLGRLPWRSVPGRPARADRQADESAIEHSLQVMELESLAERPVSHLSGGERARAMMARVLAGQPAWILADEPLASLDLAHQQRLMGQLRAETDAGRGIAVVVHDLATAMNRADRVIVLDRGRIVGNGVPDVALNETLVSEVWQVRVQWTGDSGHRALIVI